MLTEDFKVEVHTYICLNSLEFLFVSHGYKVIKHTCFRVCIFTSQLIMQVYFLDCAIGKADNISLKFY